MGNILKFLDGKKTYITAILFGIANVGVVLGWFTWEQVSIANGILAGFGLAFLRSAVDKSGKTGPN